MLFDKNFLCACPCSRIRIPDATEITNWYWIPVIPQCQREDRASNITVTGQDKDYLMTITRQCCRQVSLVIHYDTEKVDPSDQKLDENNDTNMIDDNVLVATVVAAVVVVLGFLLLFTYLTHIKRRTKPKTGNVNAVYLGGLETRREPENEYSTINDRDIHSEAQHREHNCEDTSSYFSHSLKYYVTIEENPPDVCDHGDSHPVLEPKNSVCSVTSTNFSQNSRTENYLDVGFNEIVHTTPTRNQNENEALSDFHTCPTSSENNDLSALPENTYFVLEVQNVTDTQQNKT